MAEQTRLFIGLIRPAKLLGLPIMYAAGWLFGSAILFVWVQHWAIAVLAAVAASSAAERSDRLVAPHNWLAAHLASRATAAEIAAARARAPRHAPGARRAPPRALAVERLVPRGRGPA